MHFLHLNRGVTFVFLPKHWHKQGRYCTIIRIKTTSSYEIYHSSLHKRQLLTEQTRKNLNSFRLKYIFLYTRALGARNSACYWGTHSSSPFDPRSQPEGFIQGYSSQALNGCSLSAVFAQRPL